MAANTAAVATYRNSRAAKRQTQSTLNKQYKWIDRSGHCILITAIFVVAGAADVRAIVCSDWDFWTDWKIRSGGVIAGCHHYYSVSMQYIQWVAWRFLLEQRIPRVLL